VKLKVRSICQKDFHFNQYEILLFVCLVFRHIRHTNISCLVGICMQPENALSLMIYERLNDGDLHEYLLQRSTTVNLYQQRELTDFLYISMQILSGMIYLTE